MLHISDDVDRFPCPDPSRTLPPIIRSIGSPLHGERNRCLYQSEKTKSKRMEAMRSRDSAEFISEFGSSVPLVHASMSFIDCSPCPGNITDRLIDIQSWQSALRRLSTCRRRRGNGAATLSRYSTPRLLYLCMCLRIFLRKGIRVDHPWNDSCDYWLLEVVVFGVRVRIRRILCS